jgi:hypothetical protein
MGVVVALWLWEGVKVLRLAMIGVDGIWVKGLGCSKVDVVLVWEGEWVVLVGVWVLVLVGVEVGVKGVP